MFVELMATAAAILPIHQAPALDGATTFYASFDDERQPDYGFVAGEPAGDAMPIADGRADGAWRFRDGTSVEFPLTGDAWNLESGTIEFWIRPEWDPSPGDPTSVLSLRTDGSDRLYVNRIADGRFGVAILGGPPDDPHWARSNLPPGRLRSGEWHHVAVGWHDGQIEIRLDQALLTEPSAARLLERRPTHLTLGSGDFSIDELRISDIVRYPGPVVEAGRALGRNRADREYATIEPPEAYAFAAPNEPADERFRVSAIHPSQEPSRTELPVGEASISLHAARGECEPAKVVVHALSDVGGARLRMPREPVSGLELDVRRVVRSPMRRFYSGPPEDHEIVPRFLVAADSIAVPKGEFREIWLTFCVPEDAPAGIHAGALELDVAGSAPTPIPLTLEVHPFTLPRAEGKRMGIYYMASRRMIEPRRMRAELADLRAHGVTDLILDFRLRWRRRNGEVIVTSPGLERFVDEATAAGFHDVLVVDTGLLELDRLLYSGSTDEMIEAARKGARLLEEIDSRFPGEIVVTHLDEVFNHDRLDDYIRLSRIARRAGYPRLYATFHTMDEAADRKRRRLSGFVDIRGNHGFTFEWWIARGHSMDEYEAELRQAESEAWMYHNVRGSYFPAIWARIINGVYLRASPFVLNAPWVYQDYGGNPYDDGDSTKPDLGMAFPEPGGAPGLAPTTIWEQMREGQEDVRTLALLESLAREDADRFAEDLAWLKGIDAMVRHAGFDTPSIPPAGDRANSNGGRPIDLDTGLRSGVGATGTRGEAPLIDALSQRLNGESLDAIRLEASRRIARIMESNESLRRSMPR